MLLCLHDCLHDDTLYHKHRKFQGIKFSWFFNCGSEDKFRSFCGSWLDLFMALFNYFNCNAKVPSIGKIET